MTSKESLEFFVKNIDCDVYEFDLNEVIKHKRCLEQDLERLETLISILQKFIDEEEYFVLHDNYLSLGIDGSINITQQQCDVLKSVLRFKE